jgi:hypothetical protein
MAAAVVSRASSWLPSQNGLSFNAPQRQRVSCSFDASS